MSLRNLFASFFAALFAATLFSTPASADEAMQAEVRKALETLMEKGELDDLMARGIQRYIANERRRARAEKAAAAQAKAKRMRPVSKDQDHIYGNPDAPISLVEYSDFECPFCRRFHPTTQKLVDASDGKINLVYRHFPLGFHDPGASKEAEASECVADIAGNDAFWKFIDAIYERTHSGGKGFPVEQLKPLAEEIGVDGDKFQACMDSGKMRARVKADLRNGAEAGITGTPGTIMVHHASGKVVVGAGAVPLGRLQAQARQLEQDAGGK